jgi:hypothetical protein
VLGCMLSAMMLFPDGNPQRSHLAAPFGNLHAPDRLWPVLLHPERSLKFVQIVFCPCSNCFTLCPSTPAAPALSFTSFDAVCQRRQHALDPHRSFHPRPVSALSLCVLCNPCGHYRRFAFALPRCVAHSSTFRLPSLGAVLLSALLAASHRCGTMKALTPAPLTDGPGLPAYCATPSCRSISNQVGCLVIAYHHASVTSEFRTSPWNRRLVAAPRRIEFVCLRTDSSPPVAPHPASRRRSYLRLRSCGILRHGLSPC